MSNLRKLLDAGMFASVAFHFAVCGLPFVLLIFGAGGKLFSIPHAVMGWMLAVAGILLAASLAAEIRGCGCRPARAKKICLALCCVLYAAGLAGHFRPVRASESKPGATIEECH